MRRGAKHASVQPLELRLTGGLNYSPSPADIADNECTRADNVIYDPETDKLITRPGTKCLSSAAITKGIKIGYYYKNAAAGYHVAAGNGKLYKFNAGTSVYDEIGALSDTTTVPSFVTFNGKLLIADGGSGIRTWDGTTYTTMATSPPANALGVIKNRVVANSVSDLDMVYLSGPEKESDWDTVGGSAVGIRAGYGDLLTVNGFAALQDDLIVSKYAAHQKSLYRLNVASGTTTDWYCIPISDKNCAANNRSMISIWNGIYFVDMNGFKSLMGTQKYGDIQIDNIGRKINPLFGAKSVINGIYYTPTYNALWFCKNDNVICYTERFNADLGVVVPAFTRLYFEQGRITSIYEVDNVVYLTGDNGHLYCLDDAVSTDETEQGTSVKYVSRIRTKMFAFPTDVILRKLQYYINPVASNSGKIYLAKNDSEKTAIDTFGVTAGKQEYVYDQTGYLNDATGYISSMANESILHICRNRVRDNRLAFEFECNDGRFGLDWIKAELAFIEGGE